MGNSRSAPPAAGGGTGIGWGDSADLTALDSVSRPKDSSEVPGFRLERVLS